MTDEEKRQIKTLRINGYSYREISDLLNIKRSTVCSLCRKLSIKVPEPTNHPAYRVCPWCRQLFLVGVHKNRQFCSAKCRNLYWQNEQKNMEDIEAASEVHRTLQDGLDLFSNLSDELNATDETRLGCIEER